MAQITYAGLSLMKRPIFRKLKGSNSNPDYRLHYWFKVQPNLISNNFGSSFVYICSEFLILLLEYQWKWCKIGRGKRSYPGLLNLSYSVEVSGFKILFSVSHRHNSDIWHEYLLIFVFCSKHFFVKFPQINSF